jgi:hypothetical protein
MRATATESRSAPDVARGRTREAEPVVMLSVAELARLIEAAAERGAERALARALAPLRDARTNTAAGQLVGTEEVARELGMTPQTVRLHAKELGGVQLAPRGPWRFDLERAKAANRCYGSNESQGSDLAPALGSRRRRARRRTKLPNGLPAPGSILQSRPREAH